MTDPQPFALDAGALTISQAVATFTVSESTLRRNLKQGKVEGAQLVTGPFGDSWVVPVSWLAAQFDRRPSEAEQGSDTTTAVLAPDLAPLVQLVVEQSRRIDELQTAALEAAKHTAELTAATSVAAMVTAEAERLREQNAQQAQELAQLRAVVATSRRLRRKARKAAGVEQSTD
jgi:hypothetical protein